MITSQFNEVLAELQHDRATLVLTIVKLAQKLGYTVGRKADPNATRAWKNIVLIDLPTGQVSFHIHLDDFADFESLPIYNESWDGHTLEERNSRLKKMV